MSDYELGRQAHRAVQHSVHYAHIKGMSVTQAEKLFLPTEESDTPVQFATPLTPRRQEFRRGWEDYSPTSEKSE